VSDENREFVIKGPGNVLPVIQVGDSIRGIIGFNTITNAAVGLVAIGGVGVNNTGNNELTGIFQLLVVGKTPFVNPFTPFPDFLLTFAPDPAFAEAIALGTAGASMAILYEQDTAAANNFTPDGVAIPVAEATATDGTQFWNLGFTGPRVADADGDGVLESTATGQAWVGAGADAITTTAGSSIGASNFYISRVAATGIGGAFAILPRPGYFGAGAVEVQGTSNIRGASTASAYPQETDSTIQFNVIPLPAAAWSGLALFGLLGVGKLRRALRR
jgi:hypothetical protein